MSADRFEELYERFCDGLLGEEERAEFLALLENPASRARLASIASFDAAVAEELKLAEARLEERPRKPSSRSWPKVNSRRIPIVSPGAEHESRVLNAIGFAAAALVLLILALVFVSSPKSEEPPVVFRPKAEAPTKRETPPVEPTRPPIEDARVVRPALPPEPLTPRKFEPAAPPDEPKVNSPPAPSSPRTPEKPSPRPEEPARASVTFVATVERVAGEATVGAELAAAGRGIPSGLGVSTGRGGYASFRYPDGSRVELGPETMLSRVLDGPAGKSFFLDQGMIFVDAVKQPAGRPLAVTTAQAESTVVGTQFVLAAAAAVTRLDVREGRVKFTRLPQAVSSVVVNAGHYAIAGPGPDFAPKPGVALWKAPPAGLQLWLRADSGVRPGASTVGSWNDLSSVGTAVVQDKPAAQPAYVANAFGSRPAIRFDGVDDFLTLPDGFADFRAGLSVFVVARPAPGGAWSRFIDLDVGPACDNIVFGRKDAPDKLGFWVYSNSQTRGKVEAPGAVVADQVQSFAAILSASGRVTLYRNGAAVAAGDTSIPRNILRKPNLIGKSNTGGDPTFKGDLFEILFYNRALSDAERVHVDAYLVAKYFDPTTPPASLRLADK